MKMTVAILYGGKSSEHLISCISACSLYNHIDREKYEPILIGITKENRWFYQPHPTIKDNALCINDDKENRLFISAGEGIFLSNKKLKIDFLFPVLHGSYGEDGAIQGLFELLAIPYAGSGVIGSAIGMDKIIAKKLWQTAGIPVVDFYELSIDSINDTELHKAIISKLGLPLFVKPVNAGSSVGCSKVNNTNEFNVAINSAFQFDSRIIIEKYINAREIECAVIGNNKTTVFTPGEIKALHEFYDYDAKYNDPSGALLEINATLPQKQSDLIKEYAIKAYKAILAKGFSRVDFFIDKESQEIFINEINTLPGFTSISMFPKMCESGGISYKKLISQIIEYGIESHANKIG